MIRTWRERMEDFDDVEAYTNANIYQMMQKEIDELRQELALQKLSDISQAIEQEPVAWIKQGRLGYPVLEFYKPFRYESYSIQNQPIPLYTNPPKLTFAEILYREQVNECKELLKKASEK